jgi:hypothetical protein
MEDDEMVHPNPAETEEEFAGGDEMHPAVTLLLARMESNPDEFLAQGAYNKWHRLIEPHKQYMSKCEKEAIRRGMRKIYMDNLHQQVMKQLLAPEEDAALKRAEMEERVRQMLAAKQVGSGIIPQGLVQPSVWTSVSDSTSVSPYAQATTMGSLIGSATSATSTTEYATGTNPSWWAKALGKYGFGR